MSQSCKGPWRSPHSSPRWMIREEPLSQLLQGVTSPILPEAPGQVAPQREAALSRRTPFPWPPTCPSGGSPRPGVHCSLPEPSAPPRASPAALDSSQVPSNFPPLALNILVFPIISYTAWLPDEAGCSIPTTFICDSLHSTAHLPVQQRVHSTVALVPRRPRPCVSSFLSLSSIAHHVLKT